MCENTKDKFESRRGSVVKVDTDTTGTLGERKRRTETIVTSLDSHGGGGGSGGGGVTYSK